MNIHSEVEMVSADSEWVYAVAITDQIKKGHPVPKHLKRSIFKSWVNIGWVQEKERQLSLF